jgi:4-hydroxybenzoate polyprenyltransferase
MASAGRVMGTLRGLFGLSRSVQATLSVAQPFAVALVALHGFPSLDRLIIGISAAWAGFLAVFALNDLLDVEVDRARFSHLRQYEAFDIDSALVRHPLAQRQIGVRLSVLWIGILAAYALVAAYLLNPPAAGLFLAAALLELLYCKLARVTPWKTMVSGAMVGVGALAGWVAMTGEVRPLEMSLLFLWMAAWEIGGRNIVNDFADVEEDEQLGIRTVPVVYGPRVAALMTSLFLGLTLLASLALQPASQLSTLYLAGAALVGGYLLIWPAIGLLRAPVPRNARSLFNRASLYPPAMLIVLIASLHLPPLLLGL